MGVSIQLWLQRIRARTAGSPQRVRPWFPRPAGGLLGASTSSAKEGHAIARPAYRAPPTMSESAGLCLPGAMQGRAGGPVSLHGGGSASRVDPRALGVSHAGCVLSVGLPLLLL